MSDMERRGSPPDRLATNPDGVPLIEVNDVDEGFRGLGAENTIQTKLSIGGFLIKLWSNRTNIVLHDDPRYNYLDHIIADGVLIDPKTEIAAENSIRIFPPDNEQNREAGASIIQDDVSEFDRIVYSLEQIGCPVTTFSRSPSAITMERYFRHVRGDEEIDSILGRITKEAD